MKLIIGLGNPEEKYKNNRHNVGYMVTEMLQKKRLPKEIVVKKTNIFMNSSGEIVKKLVEQYKLELPNLWVIHDDLDIPLGSYKIQKGVGPKVHNGVISINEALGTKDYWRIRIGVENRKVSQAGKVSRVPRGEEYVLQDFTDEEREILNDVIEKAVREIIQRVGQIGELRVSEYQNL